MVLSCAHWRRAGVGGAEETYGCDGLWVVDEYTSIPVFTKVRSAQRALPVCLRNVDLGAGAGANRTGASLPETTQYERAVTGRSVVAAVGHVGCLLVSSYQRLQVVVKGVRVLSLKQLLVPSTLYTSQGLVN